MKDQLKIEMHTLRQFGVMRLLKQFFASKAQWKTELPLQSISRISINIESLEVLCKKHPDFKEGGHTYYFSPQILQESLFHDFFKYIPNSAGLKIIKRSGGIDTPFPSTDKTCQSHSALAPSHKELILVHSLFFNENLGPRLYNLVEIQFQDGSVHVAYILEHVEGQIPSQKECESFIEKIQTLESRNAIKLVNWNGYKDHDFTCPACNGNLLKDKSSKALKYVDLQNFSLGDYYTYLKKIALEAAHASHFGQKSYLMGGEYLYQEVPGLSIKAKRSPGERFKVFKKLLEEAVL